MLTLFLILVSHSLSLANARIHDHDSLLGNDSDFIISKICSEILDDNRNCTIILRTDPGVLRAKTFYEFSKAVLKLALKKGIEGKKYFDEILKRGSSVGLAECGLADYVVAIANLKMALMNLNRDPQSTIHEAKVAANEVKSCEGSLIRTRLPIPQISTLNHDISLLSDIAVLAITNLFN
uniref:Pectinesterase inhibitor domain-containing protein n=1 Tax=Cajanus cajan TaxID=3821 RepID=A0A151S748_CAJCA|nr:hypothetical protein KK1_027644 [Cajanus cajan]